MGEIPRRARPESGEDGSQAWYVAEGKRGEQLLDQGQVGQATEIFEAILTRLGKAPSYGRAVILGRLGRCFYVDGRPDLAVERTRTQYAILQHSLARLAKANAKITFGCDTGLEDHLFGMSEQHELESMVKAGMTPMQVIVAATSRPAEYLKLAKMGALVAGKEADFLVLDANPLDDITNTQRISKIYMKGAEVDRASLRPSLTKTFTN